MTRAADGALRFSDNAMGVELSIEDTQSVAGG